MELELGAAVMALRLAHQSLITKHIARTDSLAGLSQARLDNDQYIIADGLGYGIWRKPMERVDSTISSKNTEQ